MARTRIILQIGENDYRKFLWFEIKGKDFYWGHSMKTAEAISTTSIVDNQFYFSIPDENQNKEFGSTHYAYHESGKKHFKIEIADKPAVYQSKSDWIEMKEISDLKRIFTMVTKQLSLYPKYNRKLTADNVNAIIIKVNEADSQKRFYLELFLMPDGEFIMPLPLIEMSVNGDPNFIESELTQEVSLVIRYLFFAGLPESTNKLVISILPEKLE